MASIYLLARWPDGEPVPRILGSFRPSNDALEEVRNWIRENYDRDTARVAVQEKCDSIPQDREPSDYEGALVLMGMAEYDTRTGRVTFEERDYDFRISEDYEGRDPDDCPKGHYEGSETLYNRLDGTPERPWL